MKYQVTCNGMFIAGSLHRKGDTFEIDEENAAKMRERTPHLTFEVYGDETKRDDGTGRNDGPDSGSGGSRLSGGSGEGESPKKRGRGKSRK